MLQQDCEGCQEPLDATMALYVDDDGRVWCGVRCWERSAEKAFDARNESGGF